MSIVGPAVVPRSWFLGGDFTWTDEDRAAQLAWSRAEQKKCPNCHTRTEDWLDKDGPAGMADPEPYTVKRMRCVGCWKQERAVLEWREALGIKPTQEQTQSAGVFHAMYPNLEWRPRPGD